MKYAAVVLAVLALLLVVSPAYAQVVGGGKKGEFAKHQRFAKSPQEAFKESRARQCPVILVICDQGFSGDWAEPGAVCRDKIKKYGKYFVILVSHPAYPIVFKWAGQYARRAGERDDDLNIYEFFDCNGCHLSKYSLRQGASSNYLSKVMGKILKEKGKGIPFAELAGVTADFKKADRMLDVEWYSEAYEIYTKLSKKKYKPEPPMVTAAKEKLKEIEETVAELFEEVKGGIEAGEKAEALVALRVLRARAGRVKIGTQLMKEINKLEKDDSITRDEKKKAEIEGKACEIFLKAEGYAADGNNRSAKMYFERVTNIYKESSFAEDAEQRLMELE